MMKSNKSFKWIMGVFILLYSCISNREQDDPIQVAYTTKEIQFVDSLKKEGYKAVELGRPIIGLYAYGQSTQRLEMSVDLDIRGLNRDSLWNINKALAITIYNTVLEDSILYDSYDIKIAINYTQPNKSQLYKTFHKYYEKDSLEKWCGFKVVHIGKNQYKRINNGPPLP